MNDPTLQHPVTLCVALTPALQQIRELERMVTGQVNRCTRVSFAAAGKGTNVARALSSLGGSACVTGFFGGPTGQMLLAELDKAGIEHRVQPVKEPTRICDTLIDRATGEVTELVAESALPEPREWEGFFQVFSESLLDAGMLVLAGAPMPGAPDTVYRDLMQTNREQGALPVLLDARMDPLLHTLPFAPLLAKMNADELGQTMGRPCNRSGEILTAGQELVKRGAQFVLVTRGARGALLISPDQSIAFTPPSMNALNPIGSGDAVTAGIAYGLQQGLPMADAVQLGMACGAANVLTLKPAEIDPVTVEELLPRIEVCRL